MERKYTPTFGKASNRLTTCLATLLAVSAPVFMGSPSAFASAEIMLQQGNPAPLSATIVAVAFPNGANISCNGGNDGIADLTVTGGIAPYSFIWSNGASTEDVGLLTAGNYSVVVTDAMGSTANASVTLTEPAPVTAGASAANAVVCEGTSTQLTVVTNAGPGAVPYPILTTVNEPIYNYQTTSSTVVVNGLSTGNIDANTIVSVCVNLNHTFTSDVSVQLVAPNGAAIFLNNRRGGSGDDYINACFSPSATVPVSYANAPFTGTWIPDQPFSNLHGGPINGTWTLHVRDNANLDQGMFVNWTLTLMSAGTTYQWSPSAGLSSPYTANPVATPTATTQYTVTVTDKYGCSATDNVLVTVDQAPEATSTVNHVTCYGGANGSIELTPTAGVAPFTYRINTQAYQTSNVFSGLNPGTYTVQVKDAKGCESGIETVTINSADPMFAFGYQNYDAPATSDCGGYSGAIELYLEGGAAPYSFMWSNGSTDQNPTNVADGFYEVLITDANGCETYAYADVYGSVGSDPVTATGTVATYSSGFNISCAGAADGSIDVTVTGGTAPYSYSWSNGATTEDVTNLVAGAYDVTITDANGCTATLNYNLTQPAAIIANAGSDQMTYFGYAGNDCATLSGSATGGNGNLSFAWSNNSNSHTTTVCPTSPTLYTLTVTDSEGCSATDNVLVHATDVSCGNGKKKDKVLICVNTKNNPHTICVSPNAVPAHLKNGGYLGECNSTARFAEEVEVAKMELTAYPNPFTNSTTISLNTSSESEIQVQVFDMNGKMVKDIFAGKAEAGVNYEYELNGNNLPAGMYICRMVSGTEQAYIKLVLTR